MSCKPKNVIRTFAFFVLLQSYLSGTEFVLFTQPKTGTHLLIPILHDLTGRSVYWAPEYAKKTETFTGDVNELFKDNDSFIFNLSHKPWDKALMDLVWDTNQSKGTYLHLHAPYSSTMEAYLAEKKCITFYVKRDPRDQLISLLNHYKHIHFNDKEVELIESDNDRISYMIKKDLRVHTLHFMKWMESPYCCTLDFEKLMGNHGGAATFKEAMEQMRKIASALEINIPNKELRAIYQKNFGHGWSFFKGKVGAWKEYFTEAHKEEVKKEIGDLLILLGYEKDLDW